VFSLKKDIKIQSDLFGEDFYSGDFFPFAGMPIILFQNRRGAMLL